MCKLVPALVRDGRRPIPNWRAPSAVDRDAAARGDPLPQTLDRGLELLDEATAELRRARALPAKPPSSSTTPTAFPLDLTRTALRQRASRRHRRLRAAMDAPARGRRAPGPAPARRRRRASGSACATESVRRNSSATTPRSAEGVVPRWCGRRRGRRAAGDEVHRVVNQTPFYGESGGQMGDTGHDAGRVARGVTVTETRRRRPAPARAFGTVETATLKLGDALELNVDHARRTGCAPTIPRPICCTTRCARCSATMSRRRARWSRRTGCASTSRIPSRWRREMRASRGDRQRDRPAERDGHTRLMALDEAIETGAMALFGEKYGDEVRVVSMGTAERGEKTGQDLFGRTVRRHACPRTGDIGLVKIVAKRRSLPGCAGSRR